MKIATYRYLVLDRDGRNREMEIDAFSGSNARMRLAEKGVVPIREIPVKGDGKFSRRFSWRPGRGFDICVFTDRLAPLLQANVPLEKALAVLEEGAEPDAARVIFELRRGLHEGRRFSALVREIACFPPVYASMLESGEEAGCLPEVVGELRKFLSEGRSFRDFVITSSIYPVIVLVVTLCVMILLFTVFIPRFAKIFSDMGRELPALTGIMVGISDFLVSFWWVLPAAVLLTVLLNALVGGSLRWQRFRDRIVMKMPVTGGLIVAVQISTFIQSLSVMVGKNVHLLSAVRIARGTIANRVLFDSFAEVEARLSEGERLSATLGGNPFMPRGTGAMLRIAEESGDVGEMLRRISGELQENIRLRVKRLLALLEPVIIMVLAVVVMLVVLAVFMAIWEMNSVR